MIRIKRSYEEPARGDGKRFLVERLWPRGMKKEELHADAWLKDVAPSTALRQWYGHVVERWPEFRQRYRKELDARPDSWAPILAAARQGAVTLLYAAHDTEHNGALVLCEYLAERQQAPATRAAKPSAKAATKPATKPVAKAPAKRKAATARRPASKPR